MRGWTCRETHTEFVDAETNSSKFYDVRILCNEQEMDYRVLTTWGRIGTSGTSKVTLMSSRDEAFRWADRRIGQKLNKGYNLVHAEDRAVSPWMLIDAGVNLHAQVNRTNVHGGVGVTLVEMRDLVESTLDMAINREGTPNPVDAAFAAARMNEKLSVLRTQMDEIAAQAEYANAAVHARVQVGENV